MPVWKFLLAFTKDWISLVSGVGSVILSVLGAAGLFPAVPPRVFWLAAAACFVVASFRIWSREHIEADRLSAARPNLELVDIKGAQLSRTGSPNFYLIQIWFKNSPRAPTNESIAREVTALITITGTQWKNPLSFYGQWARSTAPDHMGFEDIGTTTDILPNNLCAKLNVALKYPEDQMVFGFAAENFHGNARGQHPAYGFPPGTHSMKIALRGIGVASDFAFTVNNPGAREHIFTVTPV